MREITNENCVSGAREEFVRRGILKFQSMKVRVVGHSRADPRTDRRGTYFIK